jgi:hypothetical protein
MINSNAIESVFLLLNSSGVKWLLLRDVKNQLPYNLPEGKDIDILVDIHNRTDVDHLLRKNGFILARHPHRSINRMYGSHDSLFYKSKDGIILDICFELVVMSFDKKHIIPIEKSIQMSIWNNLRQVAKGSLMLPVLSIENDIVFTLAHAFLDKNKLDSDTQKYVINKIKKSNILLLREKLEKIFFRYSSRLLYLLESEKDVDFFSDYVTFSDY